MTHDPKLVEALRWHLACYFSQNRMPHMSGDPQARLLPHQKRDLHDAVDAALTALCAARPDVAAVLKGEAVAVPREDKDALILAIAKRGPLWWRDFSASPYTNG